MCVYIYIYIGLLLHRGHDAGEVEAAALQPPGDVEDMIAYSIIVYYNIL